MKPNTPKGSGLQSVQIYDTTLRDGTQREGISLTVADKMRIAQCLDGLGIAFIEGGWPGSNPKDVDFFERARDLQWTHASLAAFGSTCRVGAAPEDDPQVQALLGAGTPVCTIFGKTWLLHVTEVLRTTGDENLRLIEDTVRALRAHGRRVVYDAEHFFDGYRSDALYALETLRAAVRGGAEVVVLCDTNGGSLPWQVEEAVLAVDKTLGHPIGIHAHDDTGCAVANSLAAVRAGARHVQGTLNGYGERCGNANLCVIVPNLELKLGLRAVADGALARLSHASHVVAEVANLAPDEHMGYVGHSAFAHKGGVHVAAIRRSPRAYEHVDPALVGNRTRVVVSELSGRGNLLAKAEEHGLEVAEGAEAAVLSDLKELEASGFSFEAADASVTLMLQRKSAGYVPPFELIDYKVMVGQRGRPDSDGATTFSEATIKIRVKGELRHTAADGSGPVGALDAALRKALRSAYPEVDRIHLEDYKVRILDGSAGTGAKTRVLIDSCDGTEHWTTVGASQNILEASWYALADGIEYGLTLKARPRTGEGS